jgi:streptogrisin C
MPDHDRNDAPQGDDRERPALAGASELAVIVAKRVFSAQLHRRLTLAVLSTLLGRLSRLWHATVPVARRGCQNAKRSLMLLARLPSKRATSADRRARHGRRSARGLGAWVVVVIAITMVSVSASYPAAPSSARSESLAFTGEGLFAYPFSSSPDTPQVSSGSLVAHEEATLAREGISPARASDDLRLQGQVEEARLPLRIETALGDAYAGVWFDPAAGKFDVGVTSTASRQSVRRIAARVGLTGEVVETPVRSTWGTLIGVQEQWNKRHSTLLVSGEATSGVDPSRNAVVVTLDSAVSSHEHASLDRETASARSNIVITDSARPTARNEPKVVTCESPFTSSKARCEKTLTAGVRILLEAAALKSCTAGPMLWFWTETYMATAGHCYSNNTAKSTGRSVTTTTVKVTSEYQGTLGAKEIGNEDSYYWNEQGDMGMTKVSATSPFVQLGATPVPAFMAEWSVKPATPSAVAAAATPVMNATVCREGQTSGEWCGTITALNVTNSNSTHQVRTNVCTSSGDSGGPYVFGTLTSKSPISIEGEATSSNKNCPETTGVESAFQPLLSLASAPGYGILQTFNRQLLTANNQVRNREIPNVHFNSLPASHAITIAVAYENLSNSSVSVVCSNGLGEGEATSTEAIGKATITLNDCMGQKGAEECTVKSVGAKSEGEVVTKTLKGELGNVASSEAYTEGGLLLEPETGSTITEFTGKCLGSSTGLVGSLAAEVLPGEVSTKLIEANFAAKEGDQLISAISVKSPSCGRKTVKPKLELGGSTAVAQAYLEMEFQENLEVL